MIDLGDYDKLYVNGFFCRSDLEQLVTRLRQAEKDAARYKEIITDCRGVFVIAGDAEMVSAIDEAVK